MQELRLIGSYKIGIVGLYHASQKRNPIWMSQHIPCPCFRVGAVGCRVVVGIDRVLKVDQGDVEFDPVFNFASGPYFMEWNGLDCLNFSANFSFVVNHKKLIGRISISCKKFPDFQSMPKSSRRNRYISVLPLFNQALVHFDSICKRHSVLALSQKVCASNCGNRANCLNPAWPSIPIKAKVVAYTPSSNHNRKSPKYECCSFLPFAHAISFQKGIVA